MLCGKVSIKAIPNPATKCLLPGCLALDTSQLQEHLIETVEDVGFEGQILNTPDRSTVSLQVCCNFKQLLETELIFGKGIC